MAQDKMDLETIKRMIKSLLQKDVSRGATPEEAAAAAAKVQELLLKYNLEIADLEVGGQKAEEVGVVKLEYNARWMPHLLHIVAKHNFCTTVTRRGRRDNVHLIGRKSNIEIVQYLYASLVAQLKTMCESDTKVKNFRSTAQIRGFKKGWFLGAVAAIDDRLSKAQEVIEKNNALVLYNLREEANDYLKKNYNLVARRSRINFSNEGYGKGYQGGKRALMNPGVGGNRAPLQIGG